MAKEIIDVTKCRYNTFDGGGTQRTKCTLDNKFCEGIRTPECYFKDNYFLKMNNESLKEEIKILEYNLDSRTREMQEVIDGKEQDLQLAKQLVDRTLQFFNLTQFDWLADQNEITTEIEEQVNKLKAENEELKKLKAEIQKFLGISTKPILERLEELHERYSVCKYNVVNYKQALDEIEKIADTHIVECLTDMDYIAFIKTNNEHILDIIAKVKRGTINANI